MQSVRSICAASLLLWMGIQTLNAQSDAYARAQIEKIIRYDLSIPVDDMPGFLIGIIDHDSTYILPFGEKTKGSGDTLTADDMFQIGSVSKLISALVTLDLSDKGGIHLDSSLNRYLPELFRNPFFKATLEDVLVHAGGFPLRPENLPATQSDKDDPYRNFTETDLLSWYRDAAPDFPAGTYSHTGYALLQEALEEQTGRDFDILLAEFADILHLPHLTGQALALTPGYTISGRAVAPWSFPTFAASEGISGSMEDMLRITRYCITAEQTQGLLTSHVRPGKPNENLSGPGIFLTHPKKSVNVWMHTGRTSGHSATLAFVPQTQTGVIILGNAGTSTGELGLLILRMINQQWKRKA